jgi:hypothetical protein
VELLVAMTIFLLLVALLGQIISYANLALTSSMRQVECASQARIVFDRLALDLSARVKEGGATIIVNKLPNASDGICFLAYARTSNQISTTPANDTRLGVFGFAEELQTDPTLNASAPMLVWGNGALTWSSQSGSQSEVDNQPIRALQRAVGDLPTTYASSAGSNMLDWVPIGTDILRFEISFLLNNGTVVAVPPTNTSNSAYTAMTAPLYPLALSASTSSDTTNHTYVTALIVGVAVLDLQTRKLLVSNNGFQTLNSHLPDVSNTVGQQTPLQVWDPERAAWITGNILSKPVAQAIRFYQQTIFL